MRSFLVGLYSGFLLSALRAPLGLELLQLPARDPSAAMAYRGAALLAVAIGLLLGLRRTTKNFSPATLLSGVSLGFAAQWMFADVPSQLSVGLAFSVLLVLVIVASHRGGQEARPDKGRIVLAALAALMGWFLLEFGGPQGHSAAVFTTLVGGLAIALVGWLATPGDPAAAAAQRPAVGRAAALVVSGAGIAMACEALARPVRQLGAGQATDDHVYATIFLGLAAFGALAFGRLFGTPRSRELGRSLLLILSVVAVLAAMQVLENISTVRGLDRLVRRFGLDLSLRGMLPYDAAISAPVFVVPAFLLGTLLALCKRPADLASLLVGAAAGMILVPSRLGYELGSGPAEIAQQGHSLELALVGAGIAAFGGALTQVSGGDLSAKLRGSLGVAGLVLAVACAFLAGSRSSLKFSRPWELRPPTPVVYLEGAEGVLTVELSPAGSPVATLDGQPLAPPREAAGADIARLRSSWSLLPEGLTDPSVLLVGQLTIERMEALERLGAGRIDRSAAWHGAMPLLEERLFAGKTQALPGEILDLREARARLNAGEYDLVVVPPLGGECPTTRNLASPQETTVVVWLDGSVGVANLALGEEVIVSAPDLSELYVGLARGPGLSAARLRGEFGSAGWYAAGRPLDATPSIELLQLRLFERRQRNLAQLAARLAEAEVAPGLATALARHFAAQRIDSPYDSWQVGLELDDEALDTFARAAAAPAPDALAVEAIEALAEVLCAKRRIDSLQPTLGAAAERHWPWPRLELALGQAELELLDPGSAAARLERLLGAWPGTPGAWAMLAEAQQQDGRDEEAARSLERALELAPGLHTLERRLAIALMRAGRPEGPEALRQALLEDPEDEELLQYLSDGPWKAVRAGFHPLESHQHDH